MNSTRRTIFIISGDLDLAKRCIEELGAFGGHYRTLFVGTVVEARKRIGKSAPGAVFLDESAIDNVQGGETLEAAVAVLAESAPVVVAAAPEKQRGLAFLITSGAVDFVARTNDFLSLVAAMLDRRVRMAERAAGMLQFPNDELSGDFGEVLRHEVNNPLTGILGNTELLLARRDRLPPSNAWKPSPGWPCVCAKPCGASPTPGTSITSPPDRLERNRGREAGRLGRIEVRSSCLPASRLPASILQVLNSTSSR